MGINLHSVNFLIKAKQAGVRYDRTLCLGRQWLFANPKDINRLLPADIHPLPLVKTTWADGFFAALGAQQLDILDNSDYEGANIIQDLSQPIPQSLHNQYDFVFDGGTLEHVFEFPVGIRNCMNACKLGGHVCLWTPANNECGHGFYQFSPELFFRIFSKNNGFSLRSLVLVEKNIFSSRWYAVVDPANINARVCCVNRHPLFMLVLAQKISDVSEKPLVIFQHDYSAAWAGRNGDAAKQAHSSNVSYDTKRTLRALASLLPRGLYNRLLGFYSTYVVRRLSNKNYYRKIPKHKVDLFDEPR